MQPDVITKREAFKVLGVQTRIEPMSADYMKLWTETYMPHDATIRAASGEGGSYGLYFGTEEHGKADFLAGMAVKAVDAIPAPLVLREVPEAEYAVFKCPMSGIGDTWRGIYQDWLPGSKEYAETEGKPCFEYYPPGVHEGRALVEIYIPVKKL